MADSALTRRSRISPWRSAAEGAALPAVLAGALAWVVSDQVIYVGVAIPVLIVGAVFLWAIDPRQNAWLDGDVVHVEDRRGEQRVSLRELRLSSTPDGAPAPVLIYLDGPGVTISLRPP